MLAKTILCYWLAVESFKRLEEKTYAVTKLDLEDWSILLGELVSSGGVVGSELDEGTKDWKTWDIWETLDLWSISLAEKLDDHVDDRDNREACDLVTHGYY